MLTRSTRIALGLVSAVSAGALPAWAQTQVGRLTGDVPDGSDWFARQVAIDGGIVAVGAPYDNEMGDFAGAVYLFDAGTGDRIAKLHPDDAAANSSFGWKLAMRDGMLIVGAYRDDGGGSNAGAAYIFDAASGAQLVKLVSDDLGALDEFGDGVAIDGGVAAVAAPRIEAVYLFDATTGQQLHKLERGGAPFGDSVALAGGRVVIGDRTFQTNRGSAYLYDVATGMETDMLLASDGASRDEFGFSAAMMGGLVVVGAPLDDNSNGDGAGAAYMFDAATGAAITKLTAAAGQEDGDFGRSVAVAGGLVVVGAPRAISLQPGEAILFDGATGQELAVLTPSARVSQDLFGGSVGISGDTIVVGSQGVHAAYLFRLGDCPPDFNDDGRIDTRDVLAFLGAWTAGDGSADWNGDGSVNAADVTAFLNDWVAGC